MIWIQKLQKIKTSWRESCTVEILVEKEITLQGVPFIKIFKIELYHFTKMVKNTFWLHQQHQKCAISVLWPFTNYNFPMKHHVCSMISALIKPLYMNMTLEGVTCLGEDSPSRCTQKIDPDWIQRSWSSHYVSIQDRKSKVINSSSLHFRHF